MSAAPTRTRRGPATLLAGLLVFLLYVVLKSRSLPPEDGGSRGVPAPSLAPSAQAILGAPTPAFAGERLAPSAAPTFTEVPLSPPTQSAQRDGATRAAPVSARDDALAKGLEVAPPPSAPSPAVSALTGAAPPSPGAAAPAGAQAPKELNADLIYAVLVAELAARRGDLPLAFTHYLHAAQLSRDPKMAELAARAALSGGDDSGAERAAEIWLKLDPDSIGAHQVAALLRIKARDREGALTHLRRLVQLAGEGASTGYSQVAGIVSRTSVPAERLALMRSLVDLDPNNADAQQALALVAAGAGRPDAAVDAARRALDLRPDWNVPRLFLVRLLLSEGKRAEARTQLESFVAASPDDGSVKLLYGQLLVEEKEFAKALEVFRQLLEVEPASVDALFAAGILSLELKDVDSARIYLTRLYQTGERRDEASFYLGQVEERAKHPAAAIQWYAKAQGANTVDAQVRIAVLRAQGGEVDRAREIVQQLRDQSPEDAQMLYLVEAELLDQVGRPDEAMSVYSEAIEAFPDDQDLVYARAMYAVKLDREGAAESDLRQIIAANPDHADALNALGYTLADRTDRTDRYPEALGYIERAYKLKPQEPAILDSMGWVNYKLGNNQVALDYLRRALKSMNDGEIAAHLGEVLWAMGRHDEAWTVWDAALKEYPEHPYLKDTVGRHRVTQTERTK